MTLSDSSVPDRERSAWSLEERIEEIQSWPAFVDLQVDWNDLVERNGNHLFQRHEFIANWLAHFGKARFMILALRDNYGRLTAVLPLIASRSHIYGVPVRQWHSASNCHSGHFDFLADHPEEAARLIVGHLVARSDWDVVVLSELSGESAALELLRSASAAHLPTGRWRAAESPVLDLPQRWSDLEQSLSKKFRGSLRRKRRSLMKEGRITVHRVNEDLQVLQEGMRLEARGWKGRNGTAMIQDSSTRDFYLNLAARMALQGGLAIWTLRVDERLVAFQYGIEHAGTYYLLKLAYDEDFSRCSPGQLLMEDVLRDAVDRGLRRFDFQGDSMPWKLEWRPIGQKREWLYLFRNAPIPRMAHTLKFRIVPKLRRNAKWP